MNPDPKKYGRAEIAPVNMLEPITFDFFDGQPLPPGLGQTETPVNVLPEWTIDMGEPAATPALDVTFQVRPGADLELVTFDLFAAYAALNRYEISLGGSGLTPDEKRSALKAAEGVVRLVLTPSNASDPAGTATRLAAVAGLVNRNERPFLLERSFVACAADVCAA